MTKTRSAQGGGVGIGSALPVVEHLRLLWLQRVLGPYRRRFWRRPDLPPPLTAQQVLDRVADLRICTWSYEFEPGVRHLGPMSQDFAAAFGLGRTNRAIEEVDGIGVALLAIQVLDRRVHQLEREIGLLRGNTGPGADHPGKPPPS